MQFLFKLFFDITGNYSAKKSTFFSRGDFTFLNYNSAQTIVLSYRWITILVRKVSEFSEFPGSLPSLLILIHEIYLFMRFIYEIYWIFNFIKCNKIRLIYIYIINIDINID